jgi:spermidine synthase
VVFGNSYMGVGYDMVLVGSPSPLRIDVDAMARRLATPEYGAVARSLRAIGMTSAVDLLGTYAGRREDLEPWLAGAPITHDRDLRVEYLAGLGLNEYQQATIYRQILNYRQFPTQLFVGSAPALDQLRAVMNRAAASPAAR